MKGVEIKVFRGDKRQYEEWKAVLIACVDTSPAPVHYKMLLLKQYRDGDALKVLAKLGSSAAEYEAAKQHLQQMFGVTPQPREDP